MKIKVELFRHLIATFILVHCGFLSQGAIFNVTNNADAGAGSLRQAMLNINATGVAGPHTINFSGMTNTALGRTIDILTDLPILNKLTIIDGYTAPSYAPGAPTLYIRGNNSVFEFTNTGANGSTIRGVIIDQCASYGIHLSGMNNITVQGCWIGLTAGGGTPGAPASNRVNNHGIFINNCTNVTIGGTSATERNVIGAVMASGISIEGGSSNITITGNYIGTDVGATAARTNISHGINIVTASNITIGGITTNHRNIIAGNTGTGINLDLVTTATVMGNYVGIRNTTTALANGVNGINVLRSSGVTVGGTTINHRNIISGNGNTGVNVDLNSHGSIIRANYIGTNAAGTAAIPNGGHGIYIGNSNNCIIGGANAVQRNVVSGNGNSAGENGISIVSSNTNTIQGNFVGVTATGVATLPNFDTGLSITTSTGNTVGGATFMSRNVFSGNLNFGIFLDNVDNSTFTRNFIGVDSTGNVARGNGVHGIHSQNGSDNCTWTSNIVSGNSGVGFDMLTSSNSFYYGNYVGLGYNGTTDLGNGTIGMRFGSTSNGNTIGGALPAQRNVIAGNNNHGVMFDAFSSNNLLRGNYIGSDITGKVAIGNTTVGVFIFQNANNNTIGGTGAGEGNLISSSTAGAGIQIQISDDTKIYGNIIGLDKDKVKTPGFGNFENGILIGVHSQPGFTVTANRTIIGGTGPGQANTISNNRLDGVSLNYWDGTGNSNLNPIVGNSIYCNGGLGINHASNNVRENQGVAPPVISSRTANVISGTGNVGNIIHIYRNETADGGVWCNCEGETLIGTLTVPASGNWSLNHGLGLSTAQANAMTATATNATNSTSEFSTCANIPLPVEYIFFSAKVLGGNSGLIEWATASEKNNRYFTVQRSFDGKDFMDLKTVDGNGTTNSLNSYSIIDEDIFSSVVYYRIKQVDLDGQTSYSDVRSIVFSEESISLIHVDNQKISIVSQLENEGELFMGVYTVTGQQLFEASYTAQKGVFEKSISLSGVASGIYLVKVFSNNLRVSEKVNLK